ncbi:MAG: hypothetical protein RBG13Loki_2619 [Promethearchaeota archaeon CR_4]|nr:MAG: hypothetical protein RBG13Loki_2619 [Candidatus Lokiarchaeota archaeon CR_4]
MVLCPHGNFDVNCPICRISSQSRSPLEMSNVGQSKIQTPMPDLKLNLQVKTLEDNLRTSGVLAFEHAPQPLTRNGAGVGILGGSMDLHSERLQKSHRELPQLEDVRENNRLKIPHKEIRKNL